VLFVEIFALNRGFWLVRHRVSLRYVCGNTP